MKLLDKYQSEFCFAMDTKTYERAAWAVKPECRFVSADVEERHVIVMGEDWKPIMVFFVPATTSREVIDD